MLVHSETPLRKQMRVPRTVERSMEFSVMDWEICSASVKVSSPDYQLSQSKWRFNLIAPDLEEDDMVRASAQFTCNSSSLVLHLYWTALL